MPRRSTTCRRGVVDFLDVGDVSDDDTEQYAILDMLAGETAETAAAAVPVRGQLIVGPSGEPADPVAAPLVEEGRVILGPGSSIMYLRERLKELHQPYYGTKQALWARLSKAERVQEEQNAAQREAARRHQDARDGRVGIAAVPGPHAPSERRESYTT